MFDPDVSLLLSEAGQKQVELLQAAGYRFDRYGLLRPTGPLKALEGKIVTNLSDLRNRFQHVMLEGRTVLYFPGAFDLVHAGHAAFIEEAVRTLCERKKKSREEFFVVVLADSDSLIQGSKPAHKYAGPGQHPRPIESEEVFRHLLEGHTANNPRLLELASLKVDLVGELPSPYETKGLFADWFFSRWIRQHGAFETDAIDMIAGGSSNEDASQVLAEYGKLVAAVREGRITELLSSFDTEKLNLPAEDGERIWTLPSWQLLLHRFLGAVYSKPEAGCYRVVSARDSYSQIVTRLMQISRINCIPFEDTHVFSTSSLLERVGWKKLYQAKADAIRELVV